MVLVTKDHFDHLLIWLNMICSLEARAKPRYSFENIGMEDITSCGNHCLKIVQVVFLGDWGNKYISLLPAENGTLVELSRLWSQELSDLLKFQRMVVCG